MIRKSLPFLLTFTFCLVLFSCGEEEAVTTVSSPDGNITLHFDLSSNGQPSYTVAHKGNKVIDTSYMSFDFKEMESLKDGFKLVNANSSSVSESWEMPWGEQRMVDNTYNQLSIQLQEDKEGLLLSTMTIHK